VEPVLDRLLRLWGSSPLLRRLMQLEALASLSQPAAGPGDLPMGVADMAE
jgi:hypothetical protein